MPKAKVKDILTYGVKLMYDIKEEMIDFVIQKIRLLNPNKYSM